MYRFNQYYIPDRMMPGITQYIEQGIRPGSFLQAVISNDLKEAIGQADDENINNLPAYVGYFYNEAPSLCWGSVQRMEGWMDARRSEAQLFDDICATRASLDGLYKEAAAEA